MGRLPSVVSLPPSPGFGATSQPWADFRSAFSAGGARPDIDSREFAGVVSKLRLARTLAPPNLCFIRMNRWLGIIPHPRARTNPPSRRYGGTGRRDEAVISCQARLWAFAIPN